MDVRGPHLYRLDHDGGQYHDELHVAEHGHHSNDDGSVRIDRGHASANVTAAASATTTTGSNDDHIDKR